MKQHIRWSIMFALATCFIQCKSENNQQFLITADSVGKISRSSAFSDLETLFASDSLVKDTTRITLGANTSKVSVYEKGGRHLLTLTPSTDSIPKVENIRIFDPRYKTEKGVGLHSTFKDIKTHYNIKKIVTALNNVVVFVKGSDVYFTIDKQELPASLRYASSVTIEEVQIPDAAKIKYLMVGW
ncbi:hypothetical protein U1E44_07045 [Arenibacter sp. GZD96]|uniref:hypothetical protein n=1 Tax=Aurantibrevibacter litoralis TaxID=3106030 RepID=UPI002AFE1DEA|nr:hypothetical protein [Arenibacter sp. GZD-96]MEA1785841.1 hypothetical protein [Arenibacter sp. GZD-96]